MLRVPAVLGGRRALELALIFLIVAAGGWVRWVHLATPSLWWDELVEIRTAQAGDLGAVLQAVRHGAAPGSGNAGAVPLDYVALHGWLQSTPPPAAEHIERHYRFPAFVFATAALPALWLLARGVGGVIVGIVAAALLATSMPHILYAAEARHYALYVLVTIVELMAFTAVIARPSRGRLLAFTVASAAYVMAALYGIFPIAIAYLLLLEVAWRDPKARVLRAPLGGSMWLIAGALAWWVPMSAVTGLFPRGAAPPIAAFAPITESLWFFATGAPAWVGIFGASLVLAPAVWWREPTARRLALLITLSAATLPVIGAIAASKQYYFHPRHTLFLLPMVHLATALTVVGGVQRMTTRRGSVWSSVAGATLIATTLPTVVDFVRTPTPYFHTTKTCRDFRPLVQNLATWARQHPTDRYLLILEGRRPGHLANPMVGFYLRAYGLSDRVALAGVNDPLPVLAALPRLCPNGCREPQWAAKLRQVGVGEPFDQNAFMRALMNLPTPPWDVTAPTAAGLVTWAPNIPTTTPAGLTARRLDALALFEVAPPTIAGPRAALPAVR